MSSCKDFGRNPVRVDKKFWNEGLRNTGFNGIDEGQVSSVPQRVSESTQTAALVTVLLYTEETVNLKPLEPSMKGTTVTV